MRSSVASDFLKTLHHMYTIDGSQCLTYVYRILIFVAIFREQKLYSTIAGIVKSLSFGVVFRLSIGQLLQGIIESGTGVCIHHILQFVGWEDIGEDDSLRLDVGTIVGVVEDIVSCASYGNLINHLATYILIQFVHFGGHIALVTLAHQFPVFKDEWREEAFQIGHAIDGATLAILE